MGTPQKYARLMFLRSEAAHKRARGDVMPQSPPAGSKRRFERVFVMRVWREDGSASASVMRGSVVELGSGRRFFFTQLSDLKDFLSLRLTVAESGKP
jgi:hypothetical protein